MARRGKIMSDAGLLRRNFIRYFSAMGVGSTLFPGVLWARMQEEATPPKISIEAIRAAEKIAGLEFTDEERQLLLEGVNETLESLESLHQVELDNATPPALLFNPVLPGMKFSDHQEEIRISRPQPIQLGTDSIEKLAFQPITQLGHLLRTRQVRSIDLTRMYLDRLKRYDDQLHCVISLTEELGVRQALRADAEIANGRYRGPLHGIPWGAKDLLAVNGYPTTWGAAPFKEQVLDQDATVVQKLEAAGAVLIAKLTLGALAWGDVWFGGKTRNPWDLEQGSSGSSAGSASATAAGLVGFSIGSETLGSIVSPSTRCGATGLRPTFGRVSRHGAMALSWSMDKLGPICRSVEDCAIVLDAIRGEDGLDLTVQDHPFNWNADRDPLQIRLGYLKSAFDREPDSPRGQKARELEDAVLQELNELGFKMVEVVLPPDLPVGALRVILNAEAAAAFDDLTRSNRDDELVRQVKNAWPNAFREARFIPAVEYIQANRVRTRLMGQVEAALADVDVYVAPPFGGPNLLITNLTGHPSVTLPIGFAEEGSPYSISFTGRLFGEAELLTVARAFQSKTSFHLLQPERFAV